MSEELKQQILEMGVGLAGYELILVIISALFFRELNVFLGILAGTAAAAAFLCHMGYSVEHCVESGDPDYAVKTMRAHAMQRMASVLVFAIVLANFTDFNMVAAMVAILGVKAGAYCYPAVHKFLIRKAEK